MNVSTLPSGPNPHDWATREAVAQELDVDGRTVARMVEAGRLTAYYPRYRTGEQRRAMFWWPEVVAYAAARKTVSGGVHAGA